MNVDTIHVTQRLFNDKDLRENLVAQAEKTVQTQTTTANSTTVPDSLLLRNDSVFMAQLATANLTLHNSLTTASPLTGLDSLKVKAAYMSYLQTNIDALHLPIGWPVANNGQGCKLLGQWILTISGWILTIAALSFGAPFWFDLLIKLVNIRNTTRRPQSSVVPDSR